MPSHIYPPEHDPKPIRGPVNIRQWPLAIWLRIQEPRIITILQAVVYTCAALGGILALSSPPPTIAQTAGQGLTFYWAVLLILGGVLGAITALPGWWLLERAAVLACSGALLIYGVNLMFRSGEYNTNLLSSMFLILVGVLHFVIRGFRIWHYSFDPERG